MASLIPKSGIIFNFADGAPSPSKDYCQILVTWDNIIFRLWKITLNKQKNVSPVEVKDSYADFLHDERAKTEVVRVFGKSMLEYLKGLANGHIDYLPRLPHPVLANIIRHIELEDISRLSLVSKLFWQMCRSDEIWQQIYHDQSETPISDEMFSLAEAMGWRKLYFTNKLRLQVELRRHTASRQGVDREDELSDVDLYGDTTHEGVQEFIHQHALEQEQQEGEEGEEGEKAASRNKFYYPEVMTPSGIRIEQFDDDSQSEKGDGTPFLTEA